MGSFFALVPRWAIALVAGLGILLAGATGYKLGASAHKARYDALVQRLQAQELEALYRVREIEQARVEHVAELGRQHELHRQAMATALRAASADGERLRATVSAYASSPPSSPSECRVDDRTGTLAALLGEADRLAEESAGAAYALAEQVRGLQAYITYVTQE